MFLMKRNIRYFIATVQKFYMECTVKLMDMGKGYIHPEEYYVPVYLYPELFRKAAACNNMTWDEEVFLKDIDYNKNLKYYCTNPLLKKIAESLKDNSRSGYKITECFNETELKPETDIIILSACLFREGEYLIKGWREICERYADKSYLGVKENGPAIIYYLLFQTDADMKINESYRQNYRDLWEEGTDEADRIRIEELFVLHFFAIIEKLTEQIDLAEEGNKLSSGISIYKNQIINGIRDNVLNITEM
mgnify:FL=1